jgi:hypothetical protein
MVTTYLDQAMQAVRKATSGRGLNRAAVLQWQQQLQKASGEEAEQIGFMAEALMVAARTPEDRAWLQGLLAGGPQQAKQNLKQERSMPNATTSRGDAEEKEAAAGVDWANVASEVSTMLELNKAANDAWQGQGKSRTEDS